MGLGRTQIRVGNQTGVGGPFGVGGPRGTAAGLTRILLQFVTQYERGDFAKVSDDLKKLQSDQISNAQKLTDAQTRQNQLIDLNKQAIAARNKLDSEGQAILQQINAVQTQIRSQAQSVAGVQSATLAQRAALLQALETESGLTQEQITLVRNLANLDRERLSSNAALVPILEEQAALKAKIAAIPGGGAGGGAGALKGQLVGNLESLAIGAIGATVGGALLTAVFFGPLQEGIKGLTDAFGRLLDPTAKARESLKSLGDAVSQIATADSLTRLDAAKKLISDIQPKGAQSLFGPDVLATASQLQTFNDFLDKYKSYADLAAHIKELEQGRIEQGAIILEQADVALGKVRQLAEAQKLPSWLSNQTSEVIGPRSGIGGDLSSIDWESYKKQAAGYFGDLAQGADSATAHLKAVADAAAAIREQITTAALGAALQTTTDSLNAQLDTTLNALQTTADNDIATITRIADARISRITFDANKRISGLQELSSSLKVIPSARTNELQKLIDGLSNAGPSEHTKALADQIDRITKANDAAAYQSSLAAINEKKHALILAERLKLQQTEIDITKFSGKDRITAIDAELARLQKRNQEQQNFNKLLDIEYQLHKGVKRASGESIQEFIDRRAQFNRNLLQQAASLQSGGATDSLKAQKDRLDYELQLKALSEQKKKLIDDHAQKLYLARLQEQLKASTAADAAALARRRKFLSDELTASKAADQAALDAKKKAIQGEIEAIKAEATAEINSIKARAAFGIDQRKQQLARDQQAARDSTAAAITAAKAKNAQLLILAKKSDVDQRALAIEDAKSLTEVETFAGQAGGSAYGYALLKAQIEALGLQGPETDLLLKNAERLRTAAQKKMWALQTGLGDSKFLQGLFGFASGGVFPLSNAMNFGDNIRVGEQGPELGMVLSNKVVQALNNQSGNDRPLTGDIHYSGGGDRYRDMYQLKRVIREVVREELR